MTKKQTIVQPDYNSNKLYVFLEYLSAFAFIGLTTIVFWISITNVKLEIPMWIWIVTFLTGYIIADFLSGLVHWAADTYGSPATPILGPNFITPFRWHHIKPMDMCKYPFIETIANSCMLGLFLDIFVLIPLAHFYVEKNLVVFGLIMMLNFTAIATVMANQFHKWAHALRPPYVAVVLQKMKLILGPRHHDTHHTSPFDTYYCVTSGWCNYFLHRVDFWRRMERLLLWFGIKRDETASMSATTTSIVDK